MNIYTLMLYIALAAGALTGIAALTKKDSIAKRENGGGNWATIAIQNFVGSLLIFSGFVKAVDPLGTAYKMGDYFDVFDKYGLPGMELMSSLATPFAVTMIVLELVLGVNLLLGIKPKLTVWLNFLMMAFFTVLTGFTAYTGEVTDCGCFGDFLKLKPIVTFGKDVFFTALSVFLLVNSNKLLSYLPKRMGWPAIGISTLAFTLFCFQNFYWSLPVADFRPFHEGVNIPEAKAEAEADQPVIQIYYSIKNTETGETVRMLSDSFASASNSKMWKEPWKIQEDKIEEVTIEEGSTSKVKEFKLYNEDGAEITDRITEDPAYNFFVVAYDLTATSKSGFKKMGEIAQAAEKDGYATRAAYSIGKAEPLRHELQLGFPFYTGDGIMLKTIVRSNPGILLMKNGTIIKKWHHKQLPSYKEIKETYMK